MTLLNVETVLLRTIAADVVTDQCLNVLSKTVTSSDKWLQSGEVSYEQCSWAQQQLQVSWAACGHAAYTPSGVSFLALVDPVEKIPGVYVSQNLLDFL